MGETRTSALIISIRTVSIPCTKKTEDKDNNVVVACSIQTSSKTEATEPSPAIRQSFPRFFVSWICDPTGMKKLSLGSFVNAVRAATDQA